MATDVTKSQLVGSLSTLRLVRDGNLVDQQISAPPGGEGVFIVTLGSKGRTAEFTGTLRATDTTKNGAASALQTLMNSLDTREKTKQELNLFVGESTGPGALHVNRYDNIIVDSVGYGSSYGVGPGGSGFVASIDYRLVVRKLV